MRLEAPDEDEVVQEVGGDVVGQGEALTGEEVTESGTVVEEGLRVPPVAVPPPPPPVATIPLLDPRQPPVVQAQPLEAQPLQAQPLQAQMLPMDSYGSMGDPYGQAQGYADPQAGVLQGHAPVQRLRSAKQGNSTFFIVIAALLMLGIGIALFFGLARKPAGPPEGDGVIAKVDQVSGEVLLRREAGQEVKLEMGFDLRENDVIIVREGSARVAYVAEKTYLHIRSGSEVTLGQQKGGKQVRLGLGELTVEAASQPVDQPMVVLAMNARITLRGTRVTVRSRVKQTLVEVAEGSVVVDRPSDGAMVQVGAGGWTLIGEQAPLEAWEFMSGVNFNGEAVLVDGGTWLSQQKAAGEGLKAEVVGKEGPPQSVKSTQPPLGYVPGDGGVRTMLMSKLAASNAKLEIKWPQENGRYQVFVWMLEDAGNAVRSLRLNVENKMVASSLGKEMTLGSWDRFGPYLADIKDGSLELLLSADPKFENKEPHVSGIALYRLAGTGTPPAAREVKGVGVLEVDPSPLNPGEPGTPPATVPTVPD